MTVTPSSPAVGIFRDRSLAEQAIDALYTLALHLSRFAILLQALLAVFLPISRAYSLDRIQAAETSLAISPVWAYPMKRLNTMLMNIKMAIPFLLS